MKKKRLLIYICIAVLLLAVASIGINRIIHANPVISVEDALARYQNAISAVTAQTDIAINITQSKETTEDFFQMKMNPLLALILWVPKSEVFGVQAQPELSYFAVSSSQPTGI